MRDKIAMDVREIGVVIPAYNAELTIQGVVHALCNLGFMKNRIIVVNDGSDDNTVELLRTSGVQVVSHAHNRGKGSALKTGFKHACEQSFKGVVTIDADGQHRVEDILQLLKCSHMYDVVIGARDDVETMPYIRWLVNRITSLVISVLAGLSIPDVQCGLRYIGMNVLHSITLHTDRYQSESELVYKAIRHQFSVGFVSVTTVYDKETSYIHPVFDTIRFIIMAVRFLWR